MLERESKDNLAHGNPYIDKAFERSEALKKGNIPHLPLDSNNYDVGALDEIINVRQSHTALKSLYIKGISKTYKTTIGRRVTVDLPTGMSQVGTYGTFLVVKATHTIDQDHHYTNEFEAVPDELQFIALSEPTMPDARSLEAKVVKTDDPQSQGRVRVDFQFKTYSYSSWLRVMTPDGGYTGSNGKNRGLVFIPEVGSHVLVDFQMGNPAYPYVAGALFHGSNGEGGGEYNGIKSITTRNGIEIILNDNTKAIHINDGNGCVWDMDGNGNIFVKAPKSLTFETGEMKISATKNFLIDVGGNLITNVSKANNMFSNSSKNMITDAYDVYSGNTLISTKGDMTLQSDEICAYGNNKVTVHSNKNVTANSLGRMNMKSAKALAITDKPEEVKIASHHEVSIAVVQFRCNRSDRGYIGFDNFYLKETNCKPFEVHLENGVLSHKTVNGVTTVTEYNTQPEAVTALKNLYKTLPIIRKIPATGDQETEYIIPRMSIFPSTYNTSNAVHADVAPLSTVTLDIYLEIIAEITKLEMQYNTNYFDVSDITLTNKTPCPKDIIEKAVTITCKKEFAREEEINVWAHPAEKSASGESLKYLAGKLIVYPNDTTRRRKQNVVMVCVDTNWLNQPTAPASEKGQYHRFSDQCLQMVFNQALVEGTILKEPAANFLPKVDRDRSRTDFNLDLTRDPELQMRSVTDAKGHNQSKVGKYIYHMSSPNATVNGVLYGKKVGLWIMKHYPIQGSTKLNLQPNKDLYVYLKALFDRKYPNYAGTMAVFCFGEELKVNYPLGGLAMGLNNKSALILGNNTEPTVAHEVLHIMGLGHTFRNGVGVKLSKEQRFVFKEGETNNLMDYGKKVRVGGQEVSFPSGHLLWHWQWEIANTRLKV